MTLKKTVGRRQRRWANDRRIAVDTNGYVMTERDNLFAPMSPAFSNAIDAAGGGERQPQRGQPAKLRALHSSAALAINVFQYWEGRKGPELPRVLGLDGSLEHVAIERQFGTGLEGIPPTPDVVLTLSGDRLVAIESKFTEWAIRQKPRLDEFRAKYLDAGRKLWANAGLPLCQTLAEDIACGGTEFRHLDALQLLRHSLGLATESRTTGQCCTLLYLWFDDSSGSSAGKRHREEIVRFAARVDASLNFRGISYQKLMIGLSGMQGIDADWLDYLRLRYFPESQPVV